MTKNIDPVLLGGFAGEVRGYLPKIRRGLSVALDEPDRLDVLEEVHRLFHSVKGASSMIGLAPLSRIAYYAEETIEQIGAGQLPFDRPTFDALDGAASLVGQFIDELLEDRLDARPLLARAVFAFRRLRGLPEAGDEAEIARYVPPAPEEEAPPQEAPELAPPDTEDIWPPEPDDLPAPDLGDMADDASWPSPPATESFDDEISRELVAGFRLEAQDHLATMGAQLRAMARHPSDRSALLPIRHSAHTLKGAASLVGFTKLGRLAHRMEDLLDVVDATASGDALSEHLDLLFATTDLMSDLAGEPIDSTSLDPRIAELEPRYDAILAPHGAEPAVDLDQPLPDLSALATLEPSEPATTSASPSSPMVRIPLERLDELVRLVGELVVQRSTFEQHQQRFTHEVDELRLSLARLGRLAHRFETEYEVLALASGSTGSDSAGEGFDELELDRYTELHLLSREVAETNSDITAVTTELGLSVGDFDGYLTRVGRLTSEVQDKLMRLRMVPVSSLANRLHRAVRVPATEQGKQVDLTIEGESIELDKTVLETIADPLVHLLRNAVAHGIEPPELRRALGKSEHGRVWLRAFNEGTQVVLEVGDDGAGLDLERTRSMAIEGGHISVEDAETMTDLETRDLLFLPGLSTATDVSEIAGRGVGLDIVKSNVEGLKGTLDVHSEPGAGVTFTIRLPMTLAIARVLLVEARRQTFAVPLAAVHQILRIEDEDLQELGSERVLRLDGKPVPATDLGASLGLQASTDAPSRRRPVIVLRQGG
ncbi:MAG: Hpt domain-containing protein, partial [Acidobacteriota bacterium]